MTCIGMWPLDIDLALGSTVLPQIMCCNKMIKKSVTKVLQAQIQALNLDTISFLTKRGKTGLDLGGNIST